MSDAAADGSPKDAVLDALWGRVVEAWDDEKAHSALLLEHALRVQALPEVAGRYRSLVGDPERGPKAQKKLEAIVLAATQSLLAMKTPKAGQGPAVDHADCLRGVRSSSGVAGVGALGPAIGAARNARSTAA